ncbi:DNA-binding protein WhiA (plasmid) [Mycobacterium avium subsp. hominissuis]|uniref:DNA-binding protein WhiA n=1 Tax=Mycobacterium avium TaxID=1764 RepID=UPI00313FF97A
MASEVKLELSGVPVQSPALRRVEVATVMRFAGVLDCVDGQSIVSAELDSVEAARRLHVMIKDLYEPRVLLRVKPGRSVVSASKVRQYRPRCHEVQIRHDVEEFARRVGLVDRGGQRVRGLPPSVVAGDRDAMRAVWRGAFMASGELSKPGRARALQVKAPALEAAIALAGAARRLGVAAKVREVRGAVLVVVSDDEAVAALLVAMGAVESAARWVERCGRHQVTPAGRAAQGFREQNTHRAAAAAATAAARVERALEILGDGVPEDLVEAGRLRLEHRSVTLEELGRLAVPPLSKDAMAGRIRRLLEKADRYAYAHGLADTESVVALQAGA